MNLVPMIDVLFLLLAFFIISWQFSKSETELNVNVPAAEQGSDTTQQRGEIIINVFADGSIKVEGQSQTMDELLEKLTGIHKAYPNQPVRIRGDGKVEYQRIVDVMDTCGKAGIWNISFAAQRPAEKQ
jgi:biopolymer transport protein ExbD